MKRLIVCYDGTWNTADKQGAPSNVVRFARMISPTAADGVSQVVFYDQGVGTGNLVDRLAGGAFGNGLEQKIKEGYLFLAHNYEIGDEIYVFGFSRGAFTARSLVGFITACGGILHGEKGLNKLTQAWTYYRTPPEERQRYNFRVEVESHVNKEARIKCLGVWDTVGALGIPGGLFNAMNRQRYAFHDTKLSALVDNAFHAMAIDEHRGPFQASLWQKPEEVKQNQIVEQVWFAGVHADIGGGYNDTNLSDLALRWMMARVTTHSGLEFSGEQMNYFVPESVSKKSKSCVDAVGHIQKKTRGRLHNSLSGYLYSWLVPRMRTMGNQLPLMGTGPFRKLFRTSGVTNENAFQEAVHWSVMELHGRNNYAPPNLRVVLDDLRAGRIAQVALADETKHGRPWA